MALSFAVVAGEQIHLDVSLVGLMPQEVMPHQSVEVVGAGRARVNLIIRDFGLLAKINTERLRNAGRLLQRSPVRHVNDDLELALVVEGQHLHSHPFQRHERNRREQQHHHSA